MKALKRDMPNKSFAKSNIYLMCSHTHRLLFSSLLTPPTVDADAAFARVARRPYGQENASLLLLCLLKCFLNQMEGLESFHFTHVWAAWMWVWWFGCICFSSRSESRQLLYTCILIGSHEYADSSFLMRKYSFGSLSESRFYYIVVTCVPVQTKINTIWS